MSILQAHTGSLGIFKKYVVAVILLCAPEALECVLWLFECSIIKF